MLENPDEIALLIYQVAADMKKNGVSHGKIHESLTEIGVMPKEVQKVIDSLDAFMKSSAYQNGQFPPP